MRKIPLALAVLALAGTAACGSDDDTATPSPTTAGTTAAATPPTGGAAGAPAEVRALPGNRFSPSAVTLKVGQSVLVKDVDPDVPHNFVVAGVGGSKTMNNGDEFTLRFDKAGTYEFVCTFHKTQGMEGTVTVS